MTTYGNKYIFNFISQNGDEVEVCIQKKNYSGSFVRRPVGRGPVLKRERNGAILGTSLELYAECRIDQEYVELYTSSADEFRVLVYKNRELQWTGFVSPELYAEPDIAPPYDVQIIATDGLGELKNTLFDRPDESYPLGDHIDYILRKTGLSLSVDLISSLSWDDEAHNNSPSSLLSLTANLTHLASNSDYDVLQDILTSFNACITQQAGRWMIVRKTDIYNNIPLFRTAAFGSVNKTTWWPIGSLSADIVPAKRKLTLTHENNYKDSILPGLISGVSGGWEFATGVYYNDLEKAYILSDGDYIIYAMEFPVYPISVPLKLSIDARPLFNSSEEDRAVLGYFVELEGTVNGVRGTYYLVHSYDDALGRAVWQWYPERIPLMHTWWREELPEDVEQEVTTVNAVLPLGDNIRPDRIRLIVQNYPIISKYAIAVYDIALAQNDQIRGLKLIAEVGNNARESVETSVVISSSADPMLAETMYGVLRLDGGITSWHTPYNAALDLLKFLAADYAMLTALPAIRYRGTLNVPAQVTPWIPFIFERDNTYYLLETYSYDLLLDELEVELVSIPNSRVSIESETIIEIPPGGLIGSGTVSGGGGSSSGGGSGEGDNEGSTLIVDSEMDDESENPVQNKVIKAYIDAGDNLIKEEIERLKQQAGADTPSSFYHDMAAIVSHVGMITRQTREQLYNIFSYAEDGEIPSEAQWVIDTNGQHYIVRMLETETGVGFFIIGYEGFTRIEGDNTKTNQLLRDKADKKYVDGTFFSQAQFDQIASNQYVVGNVAYQTDSDTGLRRLSLSLGLRIQNDIDAAVNDRPDDNGNYTNGLVTALGVKNWVEGKNYLTSAAMNGYATKEDIKNFVKKGSTLEHYGITDAVISRLGIEPYESGVGNRMGYSYSSKGWKVDGPAMVWGLPTLNARLNADIGSGDNPGLYLSIYNGTAYQWAQIVTDKNFTRFGVKAGRSYTGAYDDDPKSANDINYPSMAGFTSHLADVPFQNGNLLTITTNPNLYVGQIAISSGGLIAFRSRTETTWTDWSTILHMGNIGKVSLPSLTLKGTTITSWDDIKASGGGNCITSDGGTINAGKVLNIGSASLVYTKSFDGFEKLIISGLTEIGNVYVRERIWLENESRLGFRNWSTGESESISSFSDLKTILGLGSLAYKNEADVVKVGFQFDSIQKGAVNILGWTESANNWKGQGAGMVVGQKDYYSRINIVGANNEPTMYISNIWGGIAYDWVKVITEKNVGTHAIEVVNSSANISPTDSRAFTTYAKGTGWATTGAAIAFASGNYKGLIQIAASHYTSNPSSYTRMFVGSTRPESEGGLQPWVEVMTNKNIDTLAMSLGQVTIGSDIDLNELLVPGSYNVSGGPTNKPTGVDDGSLLVVGDKNRYFMSQYMVGYNNELFYRLKEGKSWKEWRTVVTDGNIASYALLKTGGSIDGNLTVGGTLTLGGETINSWADVGAMPTKSQTTTSGTVSIAPNVLNKWSNALTGTLTITFASETSGVANYYMIEFTTGANRPTINLPSGVKWENGYDVLSNLVANTTYQISILNNLAVGGAF